MKICAANAAVRLAGKRESHDVGHAARLTRDICDEPPVKTLRMSICAQLITRTPDRVVAPCTRDGASGGRIGYRAVGLRFDRRDRR